MRTAGNNWASGYKTFRNGVCVGFVASLSVRSAPRFLSQDERIEIADLLSGRHSADPAVSAGHSTLFDAAHRTRSPVCPSASGAAPATVRAADAIDPPAPLRVRGPFRGRALGGRSHRWQGLAFSDRHAR